MSTGNGTPGSGHQTPDPANDPRVQGVVDSAKKGSREDIAKEVARLIFERDHPKKATEANAGKATTGGGDHGNHGNHGKGGGSGGGKSFFSTPIGFLMLALLCSMAATLIVAYGSGFIGLHWDEKRIPVIEKMIDLDKKMKDQGQSLPMAQAEPQSKPEAKLATKPVAQTGKEVLSPKTTYPCLDPDDALKAAQQHPLPNAELGIGQSMYVPPGCVSVRVNVPITKISGGGYVITDYETNEQCSVSFKQNGVVVTFGEEGCQNFINRRQGKRLVLGINDGGALYLNMKE